MYNIMHLYRILTSITFGLHRKDFLAKVWQVGVHVASWLPSAVLTFKYHHSSLPG